jgi:hypothetical protein
MKTNIIKIENIDFGITPEFLLCPYTEDAIRNKWLESVTSIIQKANNTYMGSHLIVDCEKLGVVYDEKSLYLCTPTEIKSMLSENSTIVTSGYGDKAITVISKDLEKVDKILVRLK